MRHFCALLFALLTFAQTPLFAQDATPHDVLPVIPLITDDPSFGSYGYRHHELHALGSIDQLMDLTGSNCCDGGEGGECRVTEIRQGPERLEAFLDGRWCPLPNTVMVYNGINLPEGANAVVCASNAAGIGCPAGVYCAGTNMGS